MPRLFSTARILLTVFAITTAEEQQCTDPDTCTSFDSIDPCHDLHDECKLWSNEGECHINPDWMNTNCPLSCGACQPLHPDGDDDVDGCKDQHQDCAKLASDGECLVNPDCEYHDCWLLEFLVVSLPYFCFIRCKIRYAQRMQIFLLEVCGSERRDNVRVLCCVFVLVYVTISICG